jgi:hypothetical protein
MKHLLAFFVVFFVLACSSDVEIEPEPPRPPPPGDNPSTCASCSDGSRLVLRPRGYSSADGMTMQIGSTLFDNVRQEKCSPRLADDGVLRCLPETFGGASGFADPTCQQKIAIVPPSEFCAGPPTDAGGALEFAPACAAPKGSAVFAVGAPHAGPFYQESGGQCSDVSSAYAGYSAFLYGPKIPPAEFAPVEAHE